MGYARTGGRWRWPYRAIPYAINEDDFGTDPGSTAHTAIRNAVQEWEDKTVLAFYPRTDEASYIEFVEGKESTICRTKVGMQTGRQKVFCNPPMNEGSLKHEIGHAVGLWHEHQRDDRDSFVTVWIENVVDDQRRNFTKMGEDGIEVGPYDYDSIMHYGPRALCVEWRYAVPVRGQFSFSRPALAAFGNSLHVVARPGFGLPGSLSHSWLTLGDGWEPAEYIPGTRWSFDAPALAAFGNALHMVFGSRHWQWTLRSGWKPLATASGAGMPALAVFDNTLHMVRRERSLGSNQLWHSQWNAGSGRWGAPVRIPGQYSWTAPALAVFDNALHMVRRGPGSTQLWHSQWNATNGWTPAEPIPDQRSLFGPALSALGSELHLAFSPNVIRRIWHSEFDGTSWGPKHRRDNRQTVTGPALATFNRELHSVHSRPLVPGATSGDLPRVGQTRHSVRDTTLRSISPVDAQQEGRIGQRGGLSAVDIATVESMYRGF